MSKLRVYELAKELNIKPQDVLDSLQAVSYTHLTLPTN